MCNHRRSPYETEYLLLHVAQEIIYMSQALDFCRSVRLSVFESGSLKMARVALIICRRIRTCSYRSRPLKMQLMKY